jgi:hypothetical protein
MRNFSLITSDARRALEILRGEATGEASGEDSVLVCFSGTVRDDPVSVTDAERPCRRDGLEDDDDVEEEDEEEEEEVVDVAGRSVNDRVEDDLVIAGREKVVEDRARGERNGECCAPGGETAADRAGGG